MSPYQAEQLENIRRTAERAKLHCLQMPAEKHCGSCVDLWQHVLDELGRITQPQPKPPATKEGSL